jgi:hypothetical protein
LFDFQCIDALGAQAFYVKGAVAVLQMFEIALAVTGSEVADVDVQRISGQLHHGFFDVGPDFRRKP